MKPLCIDLYCGLGGWTEGFLAEGYDVAGFDIEQHVYGEDRYPGMLAIQDVLTLHGSQFRNAAVIVASPPCQEFSYMAMPWTRAKRIAGALRGDGEFLEGYKGSRTVPALTALFDACFRIQREASEAAGRHIPLVVENVRGAQPWVGFARWNFGSYHLWGDVPALMPMTLRGVKLGAGASWYPPSDPRHQPGLDFTRLAGQKANPDGTNRPSGSWFKVADSKNRGARSTKNPGHVNQRDGHDHTRHLTNPDEHAGVKQPGLSGTRKNGKGDGWFQDGAAKHGSKSSARRAASARIAKIPFELARHIARVYHPREAAVA